MCMCLCVCICVCICVCLCGVCNCVYVGVGLCIWCVWCVCGVHGMGVGVCVGDQLQAEIKQPIHNEGQNIFPWRKHRTGPDACNAA